MGRFDIAPELLHRAKPQEPPTPEQPVETRCSCGAYVVMCRGEYHDCAVERGVALHERQTKALEQIAVSLDAIANRGLR